RVTMPNGTSTVSVVERGLVSGGWSTISLYSGARAQQPGFCLSGDKVGLWFTLSRLREREGPAAEGGGKVRVFFLLLAAGPKEDPHRCD
ncbi:MAG TPA: hypothetical protein VF485_01645, partial [Sphingomonas sp.]